MNISQLLPASVFVLIYVVIVYEYNVLIKSLTMQCEETQDFIKQNFTQVKHSKLLGTFNQVYQATVRLLTLVKTCYLTENRTL